MDYESLYDLVFGYDGIDTPKVIERLDLESGKIRGKYEIEKSSIFVQRTEYCLISILEMAGFSIFKPDYKNESFSLFAKDNNRKIIFHLCLDSEEERVVWKASELSSLYTVVIVRLEKQKEVNGMIGVSLRELLLSKY